MDDKEKRKIWKRILPVVERVTNDNLEELKKRWIQSAEDGESSVSLKDDYVDPLWGFQKDLIKEIKVNIDSSSEYIDLSPFRKGSWEDTIRSYWSGRYQSELWWKSDDEIIEEVVEETNKEEEFTKEDSETYKELLDNNVFKNRNWDKVFTEKEVEESFDYSKDLFTLNEHDDYDERVADKDGFEEWLRYQYDVYLRERASVYHLTSMEKRQCKHVTSWSNTEKDVYVEVIESFRYMDFCMIIGYEFPKHSIRKGIIKVEGWNGWRLPTWVNIRGKVVVDSVNIEGDCDYWVEAYDKKGNYDEDDLEDIKTAFHENMYDMGNEGWKTIGTRIDVDGDTEMEIEIMKLKDYPY